MACSFLSNAEEILSHKSISTRLGERFFLKNQILSARRGNKEITVYPKKLLIVSKTNSPCNYHYDRNCIENRIENLLSNVRI